LAASAYLIVTQPATVGAAVSALSVIGPVTVAGRLAVLEKKAVLKSSLQTCFLVSMTVT
jgi:hypothetical protein